jgi:hypothetical protein
MGEACQGRMLPLFVAFNEIPEIADIVRYLLQQVYHILEKNIKNSMKKLKSRKERKRREQWKSLKGFPLKCPDFFFTFFFPVSFSENLHTVAFTK